MWFEKLMGFREESPAQVRKLLAVEGNQLISLVNDKSFTFGLLETPSLAELRQRLSANSRASGKTTVSEQVVDVQRLHADPDNEGALFQVASQFNLLEMVSPSVTPEQGVGIYEHDRTQGPACAIAAGAGTIYRNYFAPVNGQVGQSANNQIDCLADLGRALGNTDNQLWEMKNGYALASMQGLQAISELMGACSEAELDMLRSRLRIGLQWQTQVTLSDSTHTVSQAYCSALPVAYSQYSPEQWAGFARLVLEAAYEATLCAGMLNSSKTGNSRVYLTLLGGGAFGNRKQWILAAIERAMALYEDSGLELVIVSYGRSDAEIQALIRRMS